jgi:hypothetical protein
MGSREKPGEYDAAAEPDEPTFTLVARDPHAPEAVEIWALLRVTAIATGAYPESDLPKVVEALHCADMMRAWRCAKHGGEMAQPSEAYYCVLTALRCLSGTNSRG